MTTRRKFLTNSSKAIAALSLASNPLFSFAAKGTNKFKPLVAIQLYSVREDMKKDPLLTLKKLADMSASAASASSASASASAAGGGAGASAGGGAAYEGI